MEQRLQVKLLQIDLGFGWFHKERLKGLVVDVLNLGQGFCGVAQNADRAHPLAKVFAICIVNALLHLPVSFCSV